MGLFFPYGDMAFLKSENVLSPGGRLRKQLPRGPFDGVFFKLFGLGNEYWTFFSLWGYGLFEI